MTSRGESRDPEVDAVPGPRRCSRTSGLGTARSPSPPVRNATVPGSGQERAASKDQGHQHRRSVREQMSDLVLVDGPDEPSAAPLLAALSAPGLVTRSRLG